MGKDEETKIDIRFSAFIFQNNPVRHIKVTCECLQNNLALMAAE
jgi:hypothetical protein